LSPIIGASQALFVVGDETGAHTRITPNFIQARDGNTIETLALNFNGGSVRIGGAGGYIRYNSELGATGIGVIAPESRLHIAGGTDASFHDLVGAISNLFLPDNFKLLVH
jgi:hypothetical protein